MEALGATLTNRPYVVAFLVAFVVLAWAERGPLRGLLWLGAGTLLGWLSEFTSVNTGFPFGHYAYHQHHFASEPWIGPVPLFASLSFAFMSYFAFSAARRLLAPWRGSGLRLATRDVEALDGAPRTMVLAAAIGMWMDTVIDPLTLIGEHWFLGDLYHYDPPGRHFGVPLMNYVGWVITIGVIVGANQALDRLLARAGVPLTRGPALPLEPFWGIGCCLGVFGFMVTVTAVLLLKGPLPGDVPLGDIFVSGLVLSAAFVVFVGLMIRRGLARP